MKVSLKQDSLAYQFGVRPSVLCRDVGAQPVPAAVASLNSFMESGFSVGSVMSPSKVVEYAMKGNPEVDAIVFYMMNHAVSMIRQKKHPYESLGECLPVVEEYHNMLAVRSARMFFYLLLICTRESRHNKMSTTDTVMKGLATKYGSAVIQFWSSIRSTSSSTAADALRNSPPNVTLGAYTSFLSDIFYQGTYSGGYGGKAWGKVADVLRDFVHGKLSAEMMLDTSFTLCHNNGPIFNKGMLFENYSHHIYKILDVQRSGQIPQLVGNNESNWSNNAEVKRLYEMCSKVIGPAFGGYVDWFLVEELGAMHSYASEKATQQTKYGYPSKFKAKLEAEKAKKELEAKKALEEEKNWVPITPTLKVKKVAYKRGA